MLCILGVSISYELQKHGSFDESYFSHGLQLLHCGAKEVVEACDSPSNESDQNSEKNEKDSGDSHGVECAA